jgi:hypothetical protein
MYCTHCGKSNTHSTNYCKYCGKEEDITQKPNIVESNTEASVPKPTSEETLKNDADSKIITSKKTNKGRLYLLLIVIVGIGFGIYRSLPLFSNSNSSKDNIYDFTIGYPPRSDFELIADKLSTEVGLATSYTAGETIGDGFITYNIIMIDFTDGKVLSDESIDAYLSGFPENRFETMVNPVKVYSKRVTFQNKYPGVESKVRSLMDGVSVYRQGIDFLVNGDAMTLSILYSADIEGQVQERFTQFINSFSI